MRKLIIVFIIFIIGCDSEKKYNDLNNELISSFTSLHFEDENLKYLDKKDLKKSFYLINTMNNLSKSKHKYFFNLLKMRLYLHQGKVSKSIKELESIKVVNPLMFNLYKGIIYELNNDSINSVVYYKKALSFNEDNFKDDFYFFQKYLINKKYTEYKDSVNNMNQFYPKLFESYENNYGKNIKLIRKKILIKDFYSNYVIPPYKD